MDFNERYKGLNKRQKDAVDSIEGPLLVIAGPGSGKTELIGLRAGNILKKTDTLPESILCLTYTDTACVNMRERLVDLIGDDGYRVSVHTFHSFCKSLIEKYPEIFFKGAGFKVIDEITRIKIIKGILEKLEYDNPFQSRHPSFGFTYLKDIIKNISYIKESGLSPEEFREMVYKNSEFLEKTEGLVDEVFSQRVSKKIFLEIERVIEEFRKRDKALMNHVKSLPFVLAESLEKAVRDRDTKEVTRWKNENTKLFNGKRVLNDYYEIEKVKNMVFIYKEYKSKMYEEGYYDFLDMLLDVAKELELNESLRSDLQERYLYFMVDEFQDTNGIQMRILNSITKDDIDNSPNFCVVGDDDQGIYRFQGAEISNILDFRKNYPLAKIVVLNKNYRSKQNIINLGRKIILKGKERLENILPEVDKTLFSKVGDVGEISIKLFNTKEEEFSYIFKKVEERAKIVKNLSNIAVIARTHKSLKEIISYFDDSNFPIYWERREDVLSKKEIRQIISIAQFSFYLLKEDGKKADELFPEILSYPFWEVKREKIFDLAKKAYNQKKSWFEIAKKEDDFLKITEFLYDLSLQARNSSLEEVIDTIIGTRKDKIRSPFKKFYFSKDRLDREKKDYLALLSALKTFIREIRNYKKGRFLKVEDMIEFLDIRKENNISIIDNNPLITEEDAILFSTAHGVKGKEFDSVFVLDCQQDSWGRLKKGDKIKLPKNTPFKRSGESREDQLKLFYVATTRAKNYLSLSSHKKKESGRDCIPLEFLTDFREKEKSVKVEPKKMAALSNSFYTPPYYKNEKKILAPLIENYKLSATGLNKFLDVSKNGPQVFFEENILSFPKRKEPSLSYGTAVHNLINHAFIEFRRSKKVMSFKKFFQIFSSYLLEERLSEEEMKKLLKRGEKALKIFYKEKKDIFKQDCEVERKIDKSKVGKVDIAGKIDKIVKNKDRISVFDFKTGKAPKSWKGENNEEKIKLWKYRNQLIFYKILIENSKEFKKNFFVDKGVLEFIEPNKRGEIRDLYLEIKKEDADRIRELIEIVGKKIRDIDFPDTSKYKKGDLRSIQEFEEDLLNRKI